MKRVTPQRNGTARLLTVGGGVPIRQRDPRDEADHQPGPSGDDTRAEYAMPPRDGSDNPDPLYDAVGAAKYLGLVGVHKHPAQAVRALCRKRRLRSTVVGGRIMIRRSWLEEYLQQSVREPVA